MWSYTSTFHTQWNIALTEQRGKCVVLSFPVAFPLCMSIIVNSLYFCNMFRPVVGHHQVGVQHPHPDIILFLCVLYTYLMMTNKKPKYIVQTQNICNIFTSCVVCGGPTQLCRYKNSLQAGRSGNRIPVGARFSASVQTGPGSHPVSYTMGTGCFSRG